MLDWLFSNKNNGKQKKLTPKPQIKFEPNQKQKKETPAIATEKIIVPEIIESPIVLNEITIPTPIVEIILEPTLNVEIVETVETPLVTTPVNEILYTETPISESQAEEIEIESDTSDRTTNDVVQQTIKGEQIMTKCKYDEDCQEPCERDNCCEIDCQDDCDCDCHDDRHCKPNLCDRTEFSWASNHCRNEGDALAVADGLISKLGYAMPFSGNVIGFSYSANKLPCCTMGERLVLQINGQDVGGFDINITCDSDYTGCFTHLKIPFCHCDSINIVSRKIINSAGQELEYDSACGILVTAIVTYKCDVKPPKPKRPQTAVLELYDVIGDRPVLLTPSTQAFDTVRLEIDPMNKMSVNGAMDEVTLLDGVYAISYRSGVDTQTSSNLFYTQYLEVDTGSGFAPYPGSTNITHDLSAAGGNVSLTGRVLIKVERGDFAIVRITHLHNLDSYTIDTTPNAANIVFERLDFRV